MKFKDPDIQEEIARYDESKGFEIAKTNCGFTMMIYMYLLWVRKGEDCVKREKLYFLTERILKKENLAFYTFSSHSRKRKLVETIINDYEENGIISKHGPKQIYYDEMGGVYWFFKYFASANDADSDLFCVLSPEKLENFLRVEYKKIMPYIEFICGDPALRYFKDPMVDYFYQEMKKNFNYYKVLVDIGINENDIEKKMEEPNYIKAMEKARAFIDLEVEAQQIQAARTGEDNTAMNQYLRMKEKRMGESDLGDLTEPDFMSQKYQAENKTPDREKPINLSKPE